jgi:hypothetical protein
MVTRGKALAAKMQDNPRVLAARQVYREFSAEATAQGLRGIDRRRYIRSNMKQFGSAKINAMAPNYLSSGTGEGDVREYEYEQR